MKKIILAIALASSSAFAADWKNELNQYAADTQNYSYTRLYADATVLTGLIPIICGPAAGITAAAAITDSLPAGNILAEILANMANTEYQTYQSFWAWDSWVNAGRGAVGGAGIFAAETIEAVTLWLAGQEDQAYQGTLKNYESTVKTAEALFSENSRCYLVLAKLAVLKNEESRRNNLPEVKPDASEELP